jgi:hypothetical protein
VIFAVGYKALMAFGLLRARRVSPDWRPCRSHSVFEGLSDRRSDSRADYCPDTAGVELVAGRAFLSEFAILAGAVVAECNGQLRGATSWPAARSLGSPLSVELCAGDVRWGLGIPRRGKVGEIPSPAQLVLAFRNDRGEGGWSVGTRHPVMGRNRGSSSARWNWHLHSAISRA